MSVFFVETYFVSPENMERITSLLNRAVSLIKEKPEKFRGLKSYQMFSQLVGEFGGHTEMWEFESMNDIDALFKTMFGDEELKKIPEEFFTLVEPGTYSTQIWTKVVDFTP
jgi:hypothetical protein